MLRYLKAAFFQRIAVAGLGDVPANLIALFAFAILGIGLPAFWLLAIGLETAYLVSLATNRRYQRTVDARHLIIESGDAQAEHEALAATLPPAVAARLKNLQSKCDRAVEIARTQDQDDYIVDGNREALAKLLNLYLRLLLARQSLVNVASQANEADLRRQMLDLQREMSGPKFPAALRESKQATLDILGRRLQNLQQREQSLAGIDSDLTRIEAQVDLAVENAGLSGQAQVVSSNIALVSQLLEPDPFGGQLGAGDEPSSTIIPPPVEAQKEAR